MFFINTYDKILETSYTLFVEKGYTATSMRMIAETAGIGKATIYHHFKDKESIAMELLNLKVREMQKVINSINDKNEPVEMFRNAAKESMIFLINSSEIFHIIRREIPSIRKILQGKISEFFDQYAQTLKESIDNGIKKEIFRSVDSMATARVFQSMIQGTFAAYYLTGRRPDPQSFDNIIEGIMDVFINGIKK